MSDLPPGVKLLEEEEKLAPPPGVKIYGEDGAPEAPPGVKLVEKEPEPYKRSPDAPPFSQPEARPPNVLRIGTYEQLIEEFGDLIGELPDPEAAKDELYKVSILSEVLDEPASNIMGQTDTVIDEMQKADLADFPLGPFGVFGGAFWSSMSDKQRIMLEGQKEWAPKFLSWYYEPMAQASIDWIEKHQNPERLRAAQEKIMGPMAPEKTGEGFFQRDWKQMKEVADTWAAIAGDQIPITLTAMVGQLSGRIVSRALGTDIGGPMLKRATEDLTALLVSAPSMVFLESGSFILNAKAAGIDADIADKWMRPYGLGAGAIEYMQQLTRVGGKKNPLRRLSKKMQKKVLMNTLVFIGGAVFEGIEEVSQGGLERHFLGKAIDEMKARHPGWTMPKPEIFGEESKREFWTGFGMGMLIGGGNTIARGAWDAFTPGMKNRYQAAGWEEAPDGGAYLSEETQAWMRKQRGGFQEKLRKDLQELGPGPDIGKPSFSIKELTKEWAERARADEEARQVTEVQGLEVAEVVEGETPSAVGTPVAELDVELAPGQKEFKTKLGGVNLENYYGYDVTRVVKAREAIQPEDVTPEIIEDRIQKELEGKPHGDEIEGAIHYIFTGGLPGAGKTQQLNERLLEMARSRGHKVEGISEERKIVLINEMRELYVDDNPDHIKVVMDNVTPEFHETASAINKQLKDRAIDGGYNIIYDSQLTNYPLAEDMIERGLKQGAGIDINFTIIPPVEAKARSFIRAVEDPKHRVIAPEAIDKGEARGLATFLELYNKYGKHPLIEFGLVDNDVPYGELPVRIIDRNEVLNQEALDKLLETDYRKIGEGEDVRFEKVEEKGAKDSETIREEVHSRIGEILTTKSPAATADIKRAYSGIVDLQKPAVKPVEVTKAPYHGWFTSYKDAEKTVEVFKNPSQKEIEEVTKEAGFARVAVEVTKEGPANVYIWRGDSTHQSASQEGVPHTFGFTPREGTVELSREYYSLGYGEKGINQLIDVARNYFPEITAFEGGGHVIVGKVVAEAKPVKPAKLPLIPTEREVTTAEEYEAKVTRVKIEAAKSLQKQSVQAILAGDISNMKEVKQLARIMRDEEQTKYQTESAILNDIKEQGKINVRFFRGAEELENIPAWVKMQVFTNKPTAMDLDEMGAALHMTDVELIQRLQDLARIEKPTRAVQDYIEEARQAILAIPLTVIETEKAVGEMEKTVEKAGKRGVTRGKQVQAAKEIEARKGKRVKEKEKKTARAELNKMIGDLKKIKLEKWAPQFKAPVKEVLDNLVLVRYRTDKKLRELSRMKEYIEKHEHSEMPQYVLDKVAQLEKKTIGDMSLEDFKNVHDMTMHYSKLNNLLFEIKDVRARRSFEETKKNVIAEMRDPKKIKDEIVRSQKYKHPGVGKVGDLIITTFGIRHDHYDLIIESISGQNSTLDKFLYQNILLGAQLEVEYKREVYKKFQEDIAAAGFDVKNVHKWLNEKLIIEGVGVTDPETGRVRRLELTRNEKFALYRNWLNDDNRASILAKGFGLPSSENRLKPYQITEEAFQTLVDSMDKNELIFAGDAATDLLDLQGEEIARVFLEKNGYEMTLEDFYWHKDVMPTVYQSSLEEQEIKEKIGEKVARVGMPKGRLEKRKRVLTPVYVRAFTYEMNKGITWAAAYINLEIPLAEASKILYDQEFKYELERRYGKRVWPEIEAGLKDIAGDWGTYSSVEEGLMKLKNKMSTAMLGANPFVMLKQTLSYPTYLPYVKARFLVAGLHDYIWHSKELQERHSLYSSEYAERIEAGYSRDVADIYKVTSNERLFGGKRTFQQKMMVGIQWYDKQTVTPGMHAAVLQVLHEFKKGKLSREVKIALNMKNEEIAGLSAHEKMSKAYDYAEYVTQRTQPAFQRLHQGSLQRGKPVEQLFTQFSSYTNQALNLMRRSLREAKRTGDKGAYAKAAKALFAVMVLNTLGNVGIDRLRDFIYGREPDPLLADLIQSWAGYMFFIRDLASAIVSQADKGTFLGYDVSLPVLRAPDLFANMIANGIRAFTEANALDRRKASRMFIDNALELGLMLYGLPYSTPKKLIESALKNIGGH